MKRFSAKDARQGRKGRPVLIVLLSSLILVIVVWIVLEIYGRIESENNNSFLNDNQAPDVIVPLEPPASGQEN